MKRNASARLRATDRWSSGAGLAPGESVAVWAIGEARRNRVRRVVVVTTALLVAIVAVAGMSLSVGAYPIAVLDIPAVLLGSGDPTAEFVLTDVRGPRLVAGLGVGFAFGVSGAIFQSLVDNELASPDIIGITAGSGLAAVVMIVLAGSSPAHLFGAALVGGLATAAGIFLLAHRGGVSGYRLILVGIAVAALLGACTEFLLLRAQENELQRASIWLVGSLQGRDWDQVVVLCAALIVLIPAAVALRRTLRALQLGHDLASGLGIPVGRARAWILLVGVALAAFATAAAGPVAFVAFVSAPITRRLLGNGDPAPLVSGLFGAFLLTAADLIARLKIGDIELPVGIVTGILGAPYLIWLLINSDRSTSGG